MSSRRSRRFLDFSDPVGVLMSAVKGELAIGSVAGLATATSEEFAPWPSVDVAEGADILPSKKVSLRLITCFTGLTA